MEDVDRGEHNAEATADEEDRLPLLTPRFRDP